MNEKKKCKSKQEEKDYNLFPVPVPAMFKLIYSHSFLLNSNFSCLSFSWISANETILCVDCYTTDWYQKVNLNTLKTHNKFYYNMVLDSIYRNQYMKFDTDSILAKQTKKNRFKKKMIVYKPDWWIK